MSGGSSFFRLRLIAWVSRFCLAELGHTKNWKLDALTHARFSVLLTERISTSSAFAAGTFSPSPDQSDHDIFIAIRTEPIPASHSSSFSSSSSSSISRLPYFSARIASSIQTRDSPLQAQSCFGRIVVGKRNVLLVAVVGKINRVTAEVSSIRYLSSLLEEEWRPS
jgi:hypothetical protein